VVDGPDAAKGDGEKIVELNSGGIRALKAMIVDDLGVDVEKAVGAQTPSLMEANLIGHFVRSEAVDAVMGPRSLIGWIVRHLVLEHDRRAKLAIPDNLIVLIIRRL